MDIKVNDSRFVRAQDTQTRQQFRISSLGIPAYVENAIKPQFQRFPAIATNGYTSLAPRTWLYKGTETRSGADHLRQDSREARFQVRLRVPPVSAEPDRRQRQHRPQSHVQRSLHPRPAGQFAGRAPRTGSGVPAVRTSVRRSADHPGRHRLRDGVEGIRRLFPERLEGDAQAHPDARACATSSKPRSPSVTTAAWPDSIPLRPSLSKPPCWPTMPRTRRPRFRHRNSR